MPEYLLTGQTLGPYRLIQGVGRGGMAEVYLGEDERLQRKVAVKVLPASLASEGAFLARFEREAKAAARLQHPNILGVYDYGEQDGVTYLVMPFMNGGSLAQIIARARGPLPLDKIVKWTGEMGSALTYAHNQGIIHRDVKPGNMLVGPDEHLLLADFGIAKVMDASTALTNTGAAVGSPEYMAPEQANSVAEYRSDIYALGVVVFEMLTGRVPFTATTPIQLMLRQVNDPPPAPRSLNPAISPQVEAVVLRALAKRPARRYQSATDLADALKAAAAGQPTPRGAPADLSTRAATPGQQGAGAAPASVRPAQPAAAVGAPNAYSPSRSRPRPSAEPHPAPVVAAHGPRAPQANPAPWEYDAATIEDEPLEPAAITAPPRRRGQRLLLVLLVLLLVIALALGGAIAYLLTHPDFRPLGQAGVTTLALFLQRTRHFRNTTA